MSKKTTTAPDVAATVTATITAALAAGEALEWRSPFARAAAGGLPINAASGKVYRGFNILALWCAALAGGYTCPVWLTYRQARAAGGHVRKGERGTKIIFWKRRRYTATTTDAETGEKTSERREGVVMRLYSVFNAAQCDGLDATKLHPSAADALALERGELAPPTPCEADARARAVVEGYCGAPKIAEGGPGRSGAWYRPATDEVHMPPRAAFERMADYHATLFHELAHSTGHPRRLGRFRVEGPGVFGSSDYSREELVAELAAQFLCAHVGIEGVKEQGAAYLASWLKALRADPQMLISAAQAAQKAVDHIDPAAALAALEEGARRAA